MGIEGQATTAPEPRSLLPDPSLETIATWTGRSNEKAREEWREAGADRPAEAFKDAGLLSPQLSSWRETELGAQRTLEPEGKERRGGRQVQGASVWRGGRREEDGREHSDEKGCDSHFCSASS